MASPDPFAPIWTLVVIAIALVNGVAIVIRRLTEPNTSR